MRVLLHPTSPRRMKERYDLWLAAKRGEDYSRVAAPTLIVTGERDLDRVVPVDGTLEYAGLIPGARVQRLEGRHEQRPKSHIAPLANRLGHRALASRLTRPALHLQKRRKPCRCQWTTVSG